MGMAIGMKFLENPSVFPEYPADLLHVVVFIPVESVVERIAAMVVAEFLICPAQEFTAAFKTVSLHCFLS
jgi:hypothetical protein